MDVRAVEAVVLGVELEIEAQGVASDRHQRAIGRVAGAGSQRVEVRGHQLGALRDIQTHQQRAGCRCVRLDGRGPGA